mgnify:CR=1 FL=1
MRMTLKTFLFPTYYDESRSYSMLLLVVRIFFGVLFLTHGYDKLMAHSTMANLFADPFGIGPTLSFWMVVFAEVVCSFSLIFGLLQRLVLIPMIFTMCVALFVIHASDPLVIKELALMYLTIFVLTFFSGPGRFSIDEILRKAIS